MAASSYKRKNYAAEPLNRGIVYVAINSINNKKYFGITARVLNRRIENHWCAANNKKRKSTIFGNALKKYGKENIKFYKIFEASSYDEAKFIERGLIEIFKPEYNTTSGGEGCIGYKHTPETLEKLSILKKGNKNRLGAKISKEQIEKTRITKAKNPNRYWLGKKRSPETIEKIRKKRLGMPIPSLKGKSLSVAALEAAAIVRRKPVICINDGNEFRSIIEAARYYNTTIPAISKVCKRKRAANYGLVFRWGIKNEQ